MNTMIEKYLRHYLGKEKVDFALMVSGDWGAGKSWFIQDYLNQNFPETMAGIIQISAFGCSTSADLDDRIFELVHPFLASKTFKITSKIFRSAIKAGFKIDIDKDGKPDATIGVPNLDLKEIAKNDYQVLIIDDVERSTMTPIALLSYVQQIIEKSGLKVILICNESEWINLLESKALTTYKLMKEKVVGPTFKIETDFDAAVDVFLKSHGDVIKSSLPELANVYKTLGYANLRAVKQILSDYDFLLGTLRSEFLENRRFLKELSTIYYLLAMQAKVGDINVTQIDGAIQAFTQHSLTYKKWVAVQSDGKPTTHRMIWGPLMDLMENYPLRGFWANIIFQVQIDMKTINEAIAESHYFVNPEGEPLMEILNNFLTLDPAEFEKKLTAVISGLSHKRYNNPGEIMHVLGVVLRLDEYKALPNPLDEFLDTIFAAVEAKVAAGDVILNNGEISLDEHFYGIAHFGSRHPRFSEIRNKLLDRLQKSVEINVKKDFADMIPQLSSKISEFIDVIQNRRWRNKVDLDLITFEPFAVAFDELSFKDQKLIIDSLLYRYTEFSSNQQPPTDKSFYKAFKAHLTSKIPNPSKPFDMQGPYLRDAVSKMP